MNFLGHAVLSFGDADLLAGNMIADQVKGKAAFQKFPERIQQGILLHRKIDAFTDAHPATARAKILFRSAYGLYAGALMDILYDHFLANDARYFPDEKTLQDFAAKCYSQLESNAAFFPPPFALFFPFMKTQNWLFNYRNLKGMKQSLLGLQRRAKYLTEVDTAFEIFIAHYYLLNQCYFECMDDLAGYVKVAP